MKLMAMIAMKEVRDSRMLTICQKQTICRRIVQSTLKRGMVLILINKRRNGQNELTDISILIVNFIFI